METPARSVVGLARHGRGKAGFLSRLVLGLAPEGGRTDGGGEMLSSYSTALMPTRSLSSGGSHEGTRGKGWLGRFARSIVGPKAR